MIQIMLSLFLIFIFFIPSSSKNLANGSQIKISPPKSVELIE